VSTHDVCGRFPLKVAGVWRSTCSKHEGHWWKPITEPTELRKLIAREAA